jgi:release factor glutamine methyltransferase
MPTTTTTTITTTTNTNATNATNATTATSWTRRVLDLGTGSGCLVLAILHSLSRRGVDVQGVGIDMSEAALDVARANAESLGVAPLCEFHLGTFAALPALRPFDVIVANPPYHLREKCHGTLDANVVRYEPGIALFAPAGSDGCTYYAEIVDNVVAGGLLKSGGMLVLEVHKGIAGQVSSLMAAAGFEGIETGRDNTGCMRLVRGCSPQLSTDEVESMGADLDALRVS